MAKLRLVLLLLAFTTIVKSFTKIDNFVPQNVLVPAFAETARTTLDKNIESLGQCLAWCSQLRDLSKRCSAFYTEAETCVTGLKLKGYESQPSDISIPYTVYEKSE